MLGSGVYGLVTSVSRQLRVGSRESGSRVVLV